MEEYLSVKDVARMMRVSQWTVLRWVRLGRIHPSRVGRTLRFSKSRLLAELDKQERGGSPRHDPALG